jgi:hypothetical protein
MAHLIRIAVTHALGARNILNQLLSLTKVVKIFISNPTVAAIGSHWSCCGFGSKIQNPQFSPKKLSDSKSTSIRGIRGPVQTQITRSKKNQFFSTQTSVLPGLTARAVSVLC